MAKTTKRVATGKRDDPATPQDESVEEVPVTEEEQQAADAAAAVAEAAQMVAEAEAALADARAKHAEAVGNAAPVPELGKHILIDVGAGSFHMVPVPPGYDAQHPDRVVVVGGQRLEHVSEHESGVWCYRRM